jgi:signal transduction histidine kinase
MRRTVDDLAGHGRLAVDGDAGPADLAVEATAVVAEYAGPAHNRSLGLVTIGEAPLPVLSADRGAVRIALGNLVGNAVRLAPRGSKVTIRWGQLGDWAWLAVGDEGPGLAPSLHARAFERGWRGRHDRDRAAGADSGRGLGLTIARQVVEAQGGALTVESDEGEGSTFTIWLPLTAEAARADVVDDDGVHPRSAPWLDLSSTPA